jgi:hypothetical protein
MTVRRLLACLAVLLVHEAVAQAQTPEPPAPLPAPPPAQPAVPTQNPEPPVTPPATGVSQGDEASWRYRYDVARERLLDGDFADAAERFDVLVGEAGDPVDRELATSMRDIARSWAGRGLALVKQSALGETALSAKSVGERTTDEIALLYGNSIVYGIGSGLWLDAHTQANSTPGIVLPMLLFSGAAAGTVALLDVGHPLRYGVAQSIVSGMYIGFEEGLVLGLWNQSSGSYDSRWQASTVADVVWGLSTAGAVGGGLLGTSLGATPGRASFVGSTALWTGVLAGFVAAAATGDGTSRGPNGWLATGLGLNAGAIAGLLTAGPVSPSIARVRFLDIGGIAGGLLFGGLYLAAADKNPQAQPASGFTALGIAGGLSMAWLATRGMPADRLEEKGAPDQASLALQPTLAPVPGGATLGVGGML